MNPEIIQKFSDQFLSKEKEIIVFEATIEG